MLMLTEMLLVQFMDSYTTIMLAYFEFYVCDFKICPRQNGRYCGI